MTNRELATFIWLAIFLVAVVVWPKTRSLLPSLMRQLVTPKLLIPLLLYAAWLVGWTWIADEFGLWASDLLGATILWGIFSGAALYYGLVKASEKKHFFRERALETVKLGAFYEFFVNLESFPLVAELALQAILILLVALQAVPVAKPDERRVQKFLVRLTVVIVLGMLVYSIVERVQHWGPDSLVASVREFALPVWLTAVSIPPIYLLALYAGYEGLFVRLRLLNGRQRLSFAAMAGVMAGLRARLIDIHDFHPPHMNAAARAQSFQVAYQATADFKRERKDSD